LWSLVLLFVMMSGEESEQNTMMCCASCGIGAGDEIKLKKCACNLVRYCGVKCQKDHRSMHKRACKKRAAELRGEILFKQPESSHFGDCPICYVPLRVDGTKSSMMVCCSKIVCIGCDYANTKCELEGRSNPCCAFCRLPRASTQAEADRYVLKRVEANDPVALCHMGNSRRMVGDLKGTFEYLSKAAELGDVTAHFNLSDLYQLGHGVAKDKTKQLYHLEVAAIGGHASARHNLAAFEWNNGRREGAVKHLIIAAKLGFDPSLELLKQHYEMGGVSKEDFASALRAHHAAVNATVTPQRKAAEEGLQQMEAISAALQN